jgi:hypothetical protein
MRRIAAVILMLLGVGFAGTGKSQAQIPGQFDLQTSASSTATATASLTATALPTDTQSTPTVTSTPGPPTVVGVAPNKSLSISGPEQGPAGTSAYTVNVTSELACFPLTEPIDVATFGSPGAAILLPVFPGTIPFQGTQHSVVTVDPTTHTAQLSLEVLNAEVGPGGLGVKAYWRLEQVSRLAQVIAPVPPTEAPTAVNTAVPVETATSTSGTPATSAATPTSTPVITAFTVAACVAPNPVPGASTATLYGETTPGAICTSTVTFSGGTVPTDFTGSAETANSSGIVAWPFTASSTASGGTGIVTCTIGPTTETGSTTFTITPGPTAVPTVAVTSTPVPGTMPGGTVVVVPIGH